MGGRVGECYNYRVYCVTWRVKYEIIERSFSGGYKCHVRVAWRNVLHRHQTATQIATSGRNGEREREREAHLCLNSVRSQQDWRFGRAVNILTEHSLLDLEVEEVLSQLLDQLFAHVLGVKLHLEVKLDRLPLLQLYVLIHHLWPHTYYIHPYTHTWTYMDIHEHTWTYIHETCVYTSVATLVAVCITGWTSIIHKSMQHHTVQLLATEGYRGGKRFLLKHTYISS